MKNTFIFSLLIGILFVTSCNNQQTKTAATPDGKETPTLTLHNHDREVTLPISPQRVVVMDVGALDVLDDLNLGNRVVAMAKQGIPNYLKSYVDAKDVINAGGLMEPNFERIHGAKPDLIIIGMRQLKDYDQYVEIAPTYVYELDNTDLLASVIKNIKDLGKLFEIEEATETRLNTLLTHLEEEKQRISESDAKAMFVMYNNGKFSTYGRNSRFGFVFDNFGVVPSSEEIQTSTHGASVSTEYILDRNPDILFIVDRNAAIGEGAIQKKGIENAMIQQTNAYQNGKMIYLDPQAWYIANGGLQSMEQSLKEVGEAY